MAHIRLFPFNLVTQDDTDISVSSANAQYPASNLKEDHSTKTVQSAEGIDELDITLDFKTQEEVDTVLIRSNALETLGHNALVTIEANFIDDFSAPPFSTTLTVDPRYGIGAAEFTEVTYRYWRLRFVTGGDQVSVSNVFIGKKIELEDNNIDFGWKYRIKDRSNFRRNKYGQRFINSRNKIKNISAQFNYLNQEELEALIDIIEENGETIPIWLIVDKDETNWERFAGQFYKNGDGVITNTSVKLYDLSLNFEEVI